MWRRWKWAGQSLGPLVWTDGRLCANYRLRAWHCEHNQRGNELYLFSFPHTHGWPARPSDRVTHSSSRTCSTAAQMSGIWVLVINFCGEEIESVQSTWCVFFGLGEQTVERKVPVGHQHVVVQLVHQITVSCDISSQKWVPPWMKGSYSGIASFAMVT